MKTARILIFGLCLFVAASSFPGQPSAAFKEVDRLQAILKALSDDRSTKEPSIAELQSIFQQVAQSSARKE